MTNVPLMRLQQVSVSYFESNRKKKEPLRDFSLDLHAGELVVVLGDSGSGKSTLLHFIAGFLRSQHHNNNNNAGHTFLHKLFQSVSSDEETKGNIYIKENDISGMEPRQRPIGLVMQKFSLYPHMSVYQNLEFPLKMKAKNEGEYRSKEERDDLVKGVARRLKISRYLNSRPEQLSGGEAQRVAIGKMLLRSPIIGLFDEAFSNLDPELRQELRQEVITEFLKDDETEQHGIVFVSHDLADAARADQIVVLNKIMHSNGDQGSTFRIFKKDEAVTAWEVMQHDQDVEIQNLILTIPKLKQRSS